MGRLYLAANYIDETSWWILPNDNQNSGHMQIVYDNGVDLLEAEINGESGSLFDLNGEWRYIPFGRDHDDNGNTPYMNDRFYTSGYYDITPLTLRAGQNANYVWELIGQIHASMADHGVEIEYDITQNSNSFITTVLNAVGIPFTQSLLNAVWPDEVWNFPGAFVDILQSGARVTDFSQTRTPIVLEVAGTAGNDYILSGIANDTLGGAAGRDTIYGDNGNDLIRGGAGHDRLYGENGNDRVDGGADNDVLRGGAGHDSLWGGDGHDILTGDDGDDWGDAGSGRDRLRGGSGNDSFGGNAGNDTLWGNRGDDMLYGDAGNDLVQGHWDNDSLWGGDGDDTLHGGSGLDWMSGDAGADLLAGGMANDVMEGGAGDDRLWGNRGNDDMEGGPGDDLIQGHWDNDTLDGGDGADTVDGGAGNDMLSGGAGNDSVTGGGGNDFLQGNSGADLLTGSGGHDTFFFAAGDGRDTISDFGVGLGGDVILLDVSGFADFDTLSSVASTVGGGVQLSFGADVLMLDGIDLGALDANDFLFV